MQDERVGAVQAGSNEAMVTLVDSILAQPATEEEIAGVQSQLGRYPRGMVAVGARCACGNPLAVVTRPLLPDGTPFPTTAYLTSPEAVKEVSHLEANGIMNDFNQDLADDEDLARLYRQAHQTYLDFRHALALRLGDSEEHIRKISAGGMPTRVKCLHALTGQSLVMGAGVNPLGDRVLSMIRPAFDPMVCRCARPWGTDLEQE